MYVRVLKIAICSVFCSQVMIQILQ